MSSGTTTTTSNSFTPASTLADRAHTLYVQERDAAGNWSPTASHVITIDVTPPAAFSVTAPATPSNNVTPAVTWGAATDTQHLVTYVLQVASTSNCAAGSIAQTYPVPPAILSGTSQSLTTLTAGTWYVCVSATDQAGNSRNATNNGYSFVIDTTPPTAGNSGTLGAATNAHASGFTVNWTAATDAVTSAANLQYLVCVATTSLATIANCEANVSTNWTTNITSSAVTGRAESTSYNYNVIVRDAAGNKTLYTASSASTTAVTLSSPSLTSASPERKTFYDAGSTKHWGFWYTGWDVRYGHSTDGNTFTTVSGALSIDSSRFTVSAKNGTVLVAYESNFDIKILRGTISGTSISWESAVTALDGSSANDSFLRPAMTIGSDDSVYVAGFHYLASGAVFTPKASKSGG